MGKGTTLVARYALAMTLTGSCAAAYAYSSTNQFLKAKSASPVAFNGDEWRAFPLTEVEKLTHNTSRFRFALPSADHQMGMSVSSCILAQIPGKLGADGQPIVRPYTPTSRDCEKGYFDMIIKKYDDGPMSSHVFSMKPGDKLEIKGPIAKLNYEANKWQRIGMIAGGTGITPMYQVLQEIVANPNDKTQVDLIYGNISEHDIILKAQLDALAQKYPNIRIHYTLDKPSAGWKGLSGFIGKQMISSIPTFPRPDTPHSLVYVCGPDGLMKAISGPKAPDYSQGELTGILKEMGFTSEKVFKF